jgi:peptide chain release factor 1
MFATLDRMESRYDEIQGLLTDPVVLEDHVLCTRYLKEQGRLVGMVTLYREYQETGRRKDDERASMEAWTDDADMVAISREEIEGLEARCTEILDELKEKLVSEDDLSGKDAIVEIRAGVGGDEASLFAADLVRMYSKYAELKGWKVDAMSSNPTEVGGFKEVIVSIQGTDVYRDLRYESGVHRVQRVPQTESSGRIHTSTCTVAVLPEAEEVEVEIRQEDLRIDRFGASGPGGQHVNKTESAIRITHQPSGLVVQCQDEKSQHKNLAKAMRVLRTRLYEQSVLEQEAERAASRKAQIGTGDRSQKIRTYNYPDNRVTDHRIAHRDNLEQVMVGHLDRTIHALRERDKEEKLKNL